jgi:hypothetical protein
MQVQSSSFSLVFVELNEPVSEPEAVATGSAWAKGDDSANSLPARSHPVATASGSDTDLFGEQQPEG